MLAPGAAAMENLMHLLREEAALYTQLVVLLRDEQQALAQGAADDIIKLTTAKAECVAQIDSLEAQRQQRTQQSGLAEQLSTSTPDTPLGQLWQHLTDLATQARDLNQLNGRMINMRLQRTQAALEVLRNDEQRPSVYGPDGQSLSSGKGRPLSSA